MNSTATIYGRLNGDATLKSLLDTYKAGAAIFAERAPDDYTPGAKPCLVIAGDVDGRPVETFTEFGRQVARDVRGYARDTGSTLALDTVMERVRSLFHNQPGSLTITGGKVTVARAIGPLVSPTTDPALIGRRVTLRLELQAT